MEALLILTSFAITLYAFRKKAYRRSVLFLFNAWWLTIFVLYSFRFLGFYSARESTFQMYLCGIAFFFVGYILVDSVYRRPKKKLIISDNHVKFKRSILIVLSIISIYILIRKTILAIPSWLSGGQGGLKTDIVQDGVLLLGGFWDVLYTYIARPLHIVVIIYSIILIFQKKRDQTIYLLAILFLIFGFLSSASRFSLLEIIVSFFAYWYLFSGLSFKMLMNKYKAIGAVVVVTTLVIAVFMLESGSLGEGVYCYLCGCIPCSDINLDRLDMGQLYGLVTFNGVLRVFLQIPKLMGLVPGAWTVLDTVYEYMIRFEETTYIADNVKYNAFVSMFTYFYADGGLFGVGLLSLLTGGFFSLINKRAIIKPSYQSYGMAMYLVILVTNSMVRAQTFLVPPVMAMVLLYFLVPQEAVMQKETLNKSYVTQV